MIVLITTHAEDGTGNLGTSSSCHIPVDEVCAFPCVFSGPSHVQQWMERVLSRPVLEIIRPLSTHWFFFCCGAVVNVPSSEERVEYFAKECVAISTFQTTVLKKQQVDARLSQPVCFQCPLIPSDIRSHVLAELFPTHHN